MRQFWDIDILSKISLDFPFFLDTSLLWFWHNESQLAVEPLRASSTLGGEILRAGVAFIWSKNSLDQGCHEKLKEVTISLPTPPFEIFMPYFPISTQVYRFGIPVLGLEPTKSRYKLNKSSWKGRKKSSCQQKHFFSFSPPKTRVFPPLSSSQFSPAFSSSFLMSVLVFSYSTKILACLRITASEASL